MVPQFQREVITDLAPHPFDICNSIFDMWPERIVCKGRGYRTSQNEEMAHITAEYVTGLLAHIEVSWLDYRKRRQVVVVGSKGMAILDCVKQKLILQYSDETQEIPVIPSNTIGDLIAHFAECIRKNQYSNTFSNLADGLLGARVVSLLEASRDSMDQDRTVTIPPVLLEAIIAR
jgi:predicted dehydrogenase